MIQRVSNIVNDDRKKLFKREFENGETYIGVFLKWILIGAAVGVAGGIISTAFIYSVQWATDIRLRYPFVVWLLPVGGLFITLMYKLAGISPGVNNALEAVRSTEKIPVLTAPLIFVGTVITQLFGGSAGKEGAAIQIGATVGYQSAQRLKVNIKDSHIFVVCGISAVFSAAFGTPVTACVFALEVVSVGVLYYAALVPCVTSSLTAFTVAKLLGVELETTLQVAAPALSWKSVLFTVLVSALCAGVSVLFCICLHKGEEIFKKYIKNSFLRIAAGGAAIALLTLAVGSTDYNGAGMDVAVRALKGDAVPYAFVLKLVFTVITMASGFKGGEIVPSLFIGATLGCTVGNIASFEPGFLAAMGVVAMFCAMLNCPMAAIMIGVEFFGAGALGFFAVAASVSYVLSGNYGLYSSQKIMYSKLRAEYININTK